MEYRGYTILKDDRGYRVITPKGQSNPFHSFQRFDKIEFAKAAIDMFEDEPELRK